MMSAQSQSQDRYQSAPQRFTPARRLEGLAPYTPPAKLPLVDLSLDANEGVAPYDAIHEALSSVDPDRVRRYPSASELESVLSGRFGVEEDQVVVTNGADDAIDRVCRVALEPGRELLVHAPTFEMIERSARLAGGSVRTVGWLDGRFPVRAMVEVISEETSLVALVSPNNPTGGVIPFEEMLEIVRASARVGAIVMIDFAYVEFADEDPTCALLAEPNVVVVRTFSKAMGIAGARVGYAVTSTQLARWLRTVGGPYPVGAPSLALAIASLASESGRRDFKERIRSEREGLSGLLRRLGCGVLESQANFVTASFSDSEFVQAALASLGISVRAFPGRPELSGLLRITLPGNAADFDRLESALRTALKPEAILFDLDGVLASSNWSRRALIIETARTFGVELTPGDIGEAKRESGAINDWVLTQRLLEERGVTRDLREVISRFEQLCLGSPEQPELREPACSLDDALLARLKQRISLVVVTGRPQEEAEWILERSGIRDCFASLICTKDTSAKPSPELVVRGMKDLGIESAWMMGNTPNDIFAARVAGVLPIGIVAPDNESGTAAAAMRESGAAKVIRALSEIEEMIR